MSIIITVLWIIKKIINILNKYYFLNQENKIFLIFDCS